MRAPTFAQLSGKATHTGCFGRERPGWVIRNDGSVSTPRHMLVL